MQEKSQERQAQMAEEERRHMVEEERQRLLQEHASNLLGFLPKVCSSEADKRGPQGVGGVCSRKGPLGAECLPPRRRGSAIGVGL